MRRRLRVLGLYPLGIDALLANQRDMEYKRHLSIR